MLVDRHCFILLQNYYYILNKLGTLTLKASARFFARRKKPWLAEAANCSLLREVLLQPQKTLKLSQELTSNFQALMEVYGKECMSRTRVFDWHKRFHESRHRRSQNF